MDGITLNRTASVGVAPTIRVLPSRRGAPQITPQFVLLILAELSLLLNCMFVSLPLAGLATILFCLGWTMRRPLTVAISLSLVCLIICWLDYYLGFVLYPKVAFGCVGMGLLLASPTLARSPGRGLKMSAAISLLLLFSLAYLNWNPSKPYKRAFLRINEGMTVDEVLAIMNDEFAGEIPPYTSRTAGIQFTLDPNLARYNAEEITLYVSEGRIVVKEYWPD